MHDLILLGQGPSMHDCPFDAETWACLSVLSHKEFEDKPYSKIFLFDHPEFKADEAVGLKVAQARGLPIISSMPLPFVAEVFPLKTICEHFNSIFFQNDISYMMGYALYLGYKSLLLWGVDQGPDRLRSAHRKFVTYWWGVATGMGVEMNEAPDSILWRKQEIV